jgi:hypothetical protein
VLASTTDPVIAAAIRAKEARAKAKTKAMAVAIPMARAAAPGHQTAACPQELRRERRQEDPDGRNVWW